ncbi:hypothetical protein LCGC14_2186480 [marine sediment metagenome]|uniref:Uncharacterized protein n=1 Tax=marine sediment metagenome TaxID=412755 RepID=A0A0F9DKU4_9ZZZZ
MAQYRKKPVVIEAVQWFGDNLDDVLALVALALDPKYASQRVEMATGSTLMIHTLEGTMQAQVNDWIIKGVKGELYPCKPDIFEATYEAI